MAEWRYLVNCVSGLEEIVQDALRVEVAGLRITECQSGLLLAQSGSEVNRQLVKARYLSSALLILAETKSSAHRFDDAVTRLTRALDRVRIPVPDFLRGKAFRIRVFDEGQPVAIEQQTRQALQSAVRGWSGLRPDPGRAEVEVWVNRRRDDPRIFLAIRLDIPARRQVAKGALKPELAAALVHGLELRGGDTVFDPFAGSGAIPAECKGRGITVLATDADAGSAQALAARAGRGEFGRGARVAQLDFLNQRQLAEFVAPGAVQAVATDPPWGIFLARSSDEMAEFYQAMWQSLDYCLAADRGRALVLAALEAPLRSTLPSGFTLSKQYRLLVNGKKAEALVVRRS